jgi:hypothetical protein
MNLDRELVERAREALAGDTGKSPTITEAVHEGLRRIVRDAARARVARHMAALDDEQRAAIADARKRG